LGVLGAEAKYTVLDREMACLPSRRVTWRVWRTGK
jgi:hypothetical protein